MAIFYMIANTQTQMGNQTKIFKAPPVVRFNGSVVKLKRNLGERGKHAILPEGFMLFSRERSPVSSRPSHTTNSKEEIAVYPNHQSWGLPHFFEGLNGELFHSY